MSPNVKTKFETSNILQILLFVREVIIRSQLLIYNESLRLLHTFLIFFIVFLHFECSFSKRPLKWGPNIFFLKSAKYCADLKVDEQINQILFKQKNLVSIKLLSRYLEKMVVGG